MLDLPGKRGLVMACEAQVRRRRDERKFGFFLRMGGCMTGRAAGLEGSLHCFSGTHGFMAVQARLFFCRDKCAGRKKKGCHKEQEKYFSFHNFSILSENLHQINQKLNEKFFADRVAKGCNILRPMPFRARAVKMVDILAVLQYYLHSSGAGEFCENQTFTTSSYLFHFSLYFFPHARSAALLPVGGRCASVH